jgi:hypothetical protein
MKTQYVLLTFILAHLAVPMIAFSADLKEACTGALNSRSGAIAVEHPVAPAEQPKPAQPKTAVINPQAGEQIKWQVISGGGGASSSTSYKVSTTIGQTAVGPVSSTNYKVNQGFWQNFSSGSCCVGVTGNVNVVGIVDLADLSALVSYLTGGGYVLPNFW